MNRLIAFFASSLLSGISLAGPIALPTEHIDRPTGFNSPEDPELHAFGSVLAMEGSTLLIGSEGGRAGNDPYSQPYFGAAFTSVKGVDGWGELARRVLRFPNGNPNRYGRAIAISGDTLVVGAAGRNNSSLPSEMRDNAGEAYVYRLVNNTWTFEQLLTPNNPGRGDAFGEAVAISGDTIVVGAPYEDSSSTLINGDVTDDSAVQAGAAYVFVRENDTWTQQAYLKAPNAEAGDGFGSSLTISGDTIVVGAPFEDSATTGISGDGADNSAIDSGAAYTFLRFGTFWIQDSYIKATNTSAQDHFAEVLTLRDDQLLIGVPDEDSSATGIDGDAFNDDALNSGAAYLFALIDGGWTQRHYLKSSNSEAGDRFGSSIALTSDRILIGAPEEDSNALGRNGDQANNEATNSGAAYLFWQLNNVWQQEAYLKSPETAFEFGTAVALTSTDAAISTSGPFIQTYQLGDKLFVNDTTDPELPILLNSGGSPHDFGTHIVGDSSNSITVTIENSGTSPLNNIQVSLSGTHTDDFILNTINVPTTLDSGESATFTAGFLPTAKGQRLADILINRTNDRGTEPFTIPLVGRGIRLPEITLLNPDSESVTVDSIAFDFGSALIGISDNPRTFTLRNDESAPITGISLTMTGTNPADFTLDTSSLANTLAPGATTSFTLAFARAGGGTRGVDFTLSSDDPDEIPFEFSARGNAISALDLAERSYLKASNTDPEDKFGYAVAISGNTMVVGAPREDSSGNAPNTNDTGNDRSNSGAAYVFVYENDQWTQQAYLKSRNSSADDIFGSAVAIDGDTIVIGAPWEDAATTGINGLGGDDSLRDSGAAYVFVRNGTTWSQEAFIKPTNPGDRDYFGTSVAISGDLMVVGSPNEDSNAQTINGDETDNSQEDAGAAYLFMRETETWTQEAYLKSANLSNYHHFGTVVAASGNTVIVGSPGEDGANGGINPEPGSFASNSGACYAFALESGIWTQQAHLKTSNPQNDEAFGSAVALEGETLLVGAPGNDRSASDVDGSESGEVRPNSGAAYLFTRTDTTWSEDTFLKASNPEEGDQFGRSVSLSGPRIFIGALAEDSAAQGFNGDALDNSATNSGAAHLFLKENDIWHHEVYFKSSNSGAGDQFGAAVAISGEFLFSGASLEDGSGIGVNPAERDDDNEDAGAVYFLDLDFLIPAEIVIEETPGVELVSGSAMVNFPAIEVGLTGDPVTLTIRNEGQLPLGGISVTLIGINKEDFLIDQSNLPSTIEGDASGTLILNFHPTRIGNRQALLLISSDDPDESLIQILLRATGSPATFESAVQVAGLTGDDAAPLAIPFNDGTPNLLKFAFNMDLSGPASGRLPSGGTMGLPAGSLVEVDGQSYWRMRFVRRRDGSLTYLPQKSSLLLPDSFDPFTAQETVTTLNSEWERVTIDEPCTTDTAQGCFYRLSITQP